MNFSKNTAIFLKMIFNERKFAMKDGYLVNEFDFEENGFDDDLSED